MFFVYILLSLKDNKTYTGYTNNTKERFYRHNSGRVRATRNRRPLVTIFIEKFDKETDAKKREMWWKSGAGRRKMKELFIEKDNNK